MLAFAHVICCLWLYQGRTYEDEGLSWIIHQYGDIDSEARLYQYVDAFYWVIVVITSVGFGDIVPVNIEEKIFAVIVMVFGGFLYAFIVGVFSELIASMNVDKAKFDSKLNGVIGYLKFQETPYVLTQKVKQFYEYRFQKRTLFDENKIYNELPTGLKIELTKHRFQDTVFTMPFFRGIGEDTVVDVCLLTIGYCVMPGDSIIKLGDTTR